MPELPEVETIARGLRAPLIGRRFTDVRIEWDNMVAAPAVEEFRARLVGQQIQDIGRRGKYLVFTLSGGDYLIIHLKMSGRLRVEPAETKVHKYDRIVFSLSDGQELRFNNMRKWGRVYLVGDAETVLGRLGPEPLDEDFTPRLLTALLARRSGVLKPLLLNQEFVAGLGNIYADEALFWAGLHPRRRANTLTDEDIARLHHAICQVLRRAIEEQGTTFDGVYRQTDGEPGRYQDHLRVFRRNGGPCPRCGETIQRIVVGGRGTHFCPCCQKIE
jgi:formamidopyrimidine-DNA glycosylase